MHVNIEAEKALSGEEGKDVFGSLVSFKTSLTWKVEGRSMRMSKRGQGSLQHHPLYNLKIELREH